MSVNAKCFIDAQFADDSPVKVYTSDAGTHTIIDKFTATNINGSSQTITINIVPSGQTSASSNKITSAFSIATNASSEITELKNHVLNPGDFIEASASVASAIVIRASGRVVT